MSQALYMDALITQNRSLSNRGVKAVVWTAAIFSLIPTVMSLVIGAPFPPIFLGLDVLGLWLALHLSMKAAARRSERVQVSDEAIKVLRRRGGAERAVWSSPTAFTRIDIDGEDDETTVTLRLSAQSLTIGELLSPGERRDFGEAVREAVRNARLQRHPV